MMLCESRVIKISIARFQWGNNCKCCHKKAWKTAANFGGNTLDRWSKNVIGYMKQESTAGRKMPKDDCADSSTHRFKQYQE